MNLFSLTDSENATIEARPGKARHDTSDSDSEDSSDDDAPLFTIKRPGSSMSHASLAAIHSSEVTRRPEHEHSAITGKPVDTGDHERRPVARQLISGRSKRNDRLSTLLVGYAKSGASKSEDNFTDPLNRVTSPQPTEKPLPTTRSAAPISTNDMASASGANHNLFPDRIGP